MPFFTSVPHFFFPGFCLVFQTFFSPPGFFFFPSLRLFVFLRSFGSPFYLFFFSNSGAVPSFFFPLCPGLFAFPHPFFFLLFQNLAPSCVGHLQFFYPSASPFYTFASPVPRFFSLCLPLISCLLCCNQCFVDGLFCRPLPLVIDAFGPPPPNIRFTFHFPCFGFVCFFPL